MFFIFIFEFYKIHFRTHHSYAACACSSIPSDLLSQLPWLCCSRPKVKELHIFTFEMLPIGYEIVAKKIKEGTRKSKHKIVLSNEKLMCRSSTELLFVFVCLFSACKIQASIYDLLVSFLYLKLHFIFAFYLLLWI